MGRLDVENLRYMSADDFRVLQAVEQGMRNHELVSGPLTAALANLRSGGTQKIVRQLQNGRLLAYERGRRFDGHRLTVSGYDYLALHALVSGGVVDGFGNQIGTGKESDVYVVYDNLGEALALKFHRLGRTSFRKLKLLRDYHKHRTHTSWLYLSAISARKEFAFMKALHDRGFPVPRPVHQSRHAVVMSIVDGVPLCEVREVENPQTLYAECMDLMIRLAECGVIHCDFNEFNLMVTEDEHIVLIDFPQMVSTVHPNAEMLFQRDVDCLRRFFSRRFHFDSDDFPVFSEIVRTEDLDTEVRASGYAREFSDIEALYRDEDDVEDSDDGEGEAVKSEGDDESGQEYGEDGDGEDEESDRFEDAVDEVPTTEDDLPEQPSTPRSFPIDSSRRVPLRSESEDTSASCRDAVDGVEAGEVGAEEDEDAEAAARRRREMKLLKQQRLEEERREARSRISQIISRSASQRSHSTAASTIAPEVLSRRLQREGKRQRRRQAERLRAKGDASAVTRSRRQNADTIRDSTTGFWAGAWD